MEKAGRSFSQVAQNTKPEKLEKKKRRLAEKKIVGDFGIWAPF